MFFQCAILLVLTGNALAQTCDELRERCDALPNANWTFIDDEALRNLPWPATKEEYTPFRALADEYCRKTNASALCKKDLITRCPDDPQVKGRWYQSFCPSSIEWSLSWVALCQSDVNPLWYYRAHRYCDIRSHSVDFKLHKELEQWPYQSNVTINNAKSLICQHLDDCVNRLDGPLYEWLSVDCGSDAVVDTMRDGCRARHTAFCST
ncbi:uncharacterized protein LOC129601543 [Paramacrobiotus metropolitanus]|uniref:uncharacterized protein LOC129601543 n=1 Tax=Paramacrobiotus metropolitanus TaxID=2943436 RepID=UPI002445C6D5|nr:uncharacterized protein LOC129601543 [Paramacrobiotus metropolitanus]